MTRTSLISMTTAALAATAALASAQPAPAGAPGPNEPRPGDPYAVGAAAAGSGSAAGSDADTATDADRARIHRDEQMPVPAAVVPVAPRPPDPPIDMPELLRSPTGWLLPAAVLYSKSTIDTGGGVSSTARVGLGDVAEFGVTTTDDVRAQNDAADKDPHRIQPYALATFRMGVAEHRLFDEQPGVTLGFDKSFERDSDNYKTRTAQLTLVASKHFGKRAALHIGGAFWDASIDGPALSQTLHDEGLAKQVRPFGGIQVMPLDKSEILVDLSWAPEFCYACSTNNAIQLRPELSWGVRYQVADWMHLESGVRVPDIGNANLLNAQIFGSVTFTSWALHHAVQSLK